MTRYVGKLADSPRGILTREAIDNRVRARIDEAIASLPGGGGATNTVHVRAAATGTADGSSFANAYGITQLGTAIANTSPGGNVNILGTDTYTSTPTITLASYITNHLTAGNEVTVRATDAAGTPVLPMDPATVYPAVADTLTNWNNISTLNAARQVADTFGYNAASLIIQGNRTADTRTTEEQYRVPWVAGGNNGSPLFVLHSVKHLRFQGIGARNVGRMFQISGAIENVWWEDCAARNILNYIALDRGSFLQPQRLTNCRDYRSDIRGHERDSIRLQYRSHDVQIIDPYHDGRRQYGDPFPTGIVIGDSSNGYYSAAGGESTQAGIIKEQGPTSIVIKGVTRMGVIVNSFDGRTTSQYRNGDGVTGEAEVGGLHLEKLLLAGHTDSGMDIKVTDGRFTMSDIICYDNKRNFRLWNTNASATPAGPCYSVRNRHRGGSGNGTAVWVGDTIVFGTLHVDNDNNHVAFTHEGPTAYVDVAAGSIRRGGSLWLSQGGAATAPQLDPSVTDTVITPVAHIPSEPWGLSADVISGTQVALSWNSGTTGVSYWEVEVDTAVVATGVGSSSTTNTIVGGLDTSSPLVVRIRAKNSADVAGEWSLPVTTTALAPPTGSPEFIAGDQATSGSRFALYANERVANRFTTLAGDIQSMFAYIDGQGPGNGDQVMKAIIYADDSGVPGALLGVSNEVTVTGGTGISWRQFTFPSTVSVSAGYIWLGLHCGTVDRVARGQVAGGVRRWAGDSYADGPADPWSGTLNNTTGYRWYAWGVRT